MIYNNNINIKARAPAANNIEIQVKIGVFFFFFWCIRVALIYGSELFCILGKCARSGRGRRVVARCYYLSVVIDRRRNHFSVFTITVFIIFRLIVVCFGCLARFCCCMKRQKRVFRGCSTSKPTICRARIPSGRGK